MHPANRLQHESSLYLQQHARNPVDWYPWGDEALARARELDRPIFLSIGYSACHWCHVMERESFEDEATAALMNEHFVNVKVDREERPDLDQIYMTSLMLLTREGGGWPLSVFLTPDLTPFYAGTYFPPHDAFGRPSFRRVLQAVADAWRTKKDQLRALGQQISQALNEANQPSDDANQPSADQANEPAPRNPRLTEALLQNALAHLKRQADRTHGGFGTAPKFPHPIDLRLLLRLHHRFGDREALDLCTQTLTAMARGGIYDQIGGGFHRYAVDERWRVPHFEKMLYDNALLLPAYLEAYQLTREEFFLKIARETMSYLQREMTSADGALYSTQDADSAGEEGRFYVWSGEEFDAVLGELAEFGRAVWGVTDQGNFEGRNILYRLESDEDLARRLGLPLAEFQAKLADCKQRLLARRSERVWPGRDEKILAAWNGMAIAALAQASPIAQDQAYLFAARAAANFLLHRLRDAQGRLLRTCRVDRPATITAYLEDYACVIDGLIELYQADFDPRWITEACQLAEHMIARHHDPVQGGFFFAAERGDLIARTKDWQDGSTPSGNGLAATVLLKLATLTGRADFHAAAEQTLAAFAPMIADFPAATPQLLTALDWYLGPTQEIAIIGSSNTAETDGVLAAALDRFRPRRLIAFRPHDHPEPPIIELLKNRPGSDDAVTIYLCENRVCLAPAHRLNQSVTLLMQRDPTAK